MPLWRAAAPWRLLCGASILLILLATTWPWTDFRGHTHWDKVEWVPFTHRLVARDVVLNVLLFVPFGFTARRGWPGVPHRTWLAVALALSLAVETYQLFSHSRFPTSTDVLTNLLGQWMGLRIATPRATHAVSASPR